MLLALFKRILIFSVILITLFSWVWKYLREILWKDLVKSIQKRSLFFVLLQAMKILSKKKLMKRHGCFGENLTVFRLWSFGENLMGVSSWVFQWKFNGVSSWVFRWEFDLISVFLIQLYLGIFILILAVLFWLW